MFGLFRPELLNNSYVGMRHGISKANEKGIISCQLDRETQSDGLSIAGAAQVKASAEKALGEGIIRKETLIFSSQFQRCRETALIVSQVTGGKTVRFIHLLNERDFGTLHGKSDEHYLEVWNEDILDPRHHYRNSQNTFEVNARILQMYVEMEGRYYHKEILFVSHGDILNINATNFVHRKPNEHRLLPHLWQQAEIIGINK